MDAQVREKKLAKLIEIVGYDSIEQLMQAVLSDSVSTAICMNEGRTFICEMGFDQDVGSWTNTMSHGRTATNLITFQNPRREFCPLLHPPFLPCERPFLRQSAARHPITPLDPLRR